MTTLGRSLGAHLVLVLVGRVVVRRVGRELGGAGVDGLERGAHARGQRGRRAPSASVRRRHSQAELRVGEAEALGPPPAAARSAPPSPAPLGEVRALLDDGAAIWSRNHGSTAGGVVAGRSTVTPRRSAASSWKGRSGVAIGRRATQLVVGRARRSCASAGIAVEPEPARARATAAPFCSDSGKVRPMAIASPTDCIGVPSTPVVPGNFSNAHRGTLVTT